MRLEEYLSIPYRLVAYSAEGEDGAWHRYAEYPEIGIKCEAETPWEALEKLDELRVRYIRERHERGEAIPVPRPPLRPPATALDPARLGFARWLAHRARISG